jgi:hydrogenase nickel incorporation protein HypB
VNQQTVVVGQDVQSERRAAAARFRADQSSKGTFVVHLLSSPGAGKTALLEATLRYFGERRRMGVLVGDLATDRDAQRLEPLAPTVQITTGGACHLDLGLVERALTQLGRSGLEFLFIEDVGNLVCPASHDLGEHLRVVLLSTTEGDDKPAKYAKAFRTSQALVISKLDLLPHVPFSVVAATTDARAIQPELRVFPVCALRNEGIDEWCGYLERMRKEMLETRKLLLPTGTSTTRAF